MTDTAVTDAAVRVTRHWGPVWPGYFADPFVLRLSDGGYVAYGTHPGSEGDRVFEALVSPDLTEWTSAGPVLERVADTLGDDYWAPEVAEAAGAFWMYYSVGRGIEGHHLRVARSDSPTGPFRDLGVDLTPDELFAIDAHPFRDADGRWYLFFARDVLDHERPGTHLAVAPLDPGMASLAGPPVPVLAPNADWQLYERDRLIHGRRFDWHTLEGPAVVLRDGRYWLTYSGGAWTGPGYAVGVATAEHVLGPWSHLEQPALLRSGGDLRGPGHNSLTVAPDGTDIIAFHSWNADATARQLHLGSLRIHQP
ncbi:glycoside hydrolase family 43 protein [Leifsonia sp. 2TAF2]|uniref:glycoside hydrolase family 43 protein n=1 Tax=Leifsonia sp. 2TAF2 TaxID=3233009 RepID=UPI003F947741